MDTYTKSAQTRVNRQIVQTYGSNTTTVDDVMVLNRSRTGNELPNRVRIIEEKGNATTELIAYDEVLVKDVRGFMKGFEGSQKRESNKTGNFQYSSFKPVMISMTSDVNLAVARATAKAYGIIQKRQSPFQSQIFAGELHQTIALLKDPFGKSIKLMSAFASRRKQSNPKSLLKRVAEGKPVSLKSVKNAGRALSESWLELRFGILPLINDINAIMQMASEKADKEQVLSYRVYGNSESATQTVDTPSDIYGFKWHTELTESIKAECVIRFGILFKLLETHEKFQSRIATDLTSLSNLPSTLWEVTPWSFLIDYFVNVSDIIQAATTSTSTVSYTSRSIIRTVTKTAVTRNCSGASSNYVVTSFSPAVLSVMRRDVHRTAASLGVPPLTFSLPGSNVRFANMAALATLFAVKRR